MGLLLIGLAACGKSKPAPAPAPAASSSAEPKTATSANAALDPAKLAMFGALPDAFESADNPLTPEKIALGRMLFYDTRLSLSREISCNTCHLLDNFGVDGHAVSEGHKKQVGKRNANTVYNAAGQFVQFWDGRAANVEEQAKGPIVNPVEMAMPAEASVIADSRLAEIPEYVELFKKAFAGEAKPVTFENLAKAIGAFERKLVTPSRWDKFLKGDASALTEAEKKGAQTFIETGCTTCHMGPLVGGNMYQKLGLVQPWPNQADLGRYEVTKSESDKMFFKVPSLRNIEKTAPYFHDGSVATLPEAVKLMAKHQLGKTLTDEQTESIVTWLKALTGTVAADYVAKPALPPDPTSKPKAGRKKG
jgi:cytochrome c peroxidase